YRDDLLDDFLPGSLSRFDEAPDAALSLVPILHQSFVHRKAPGDCVTQRGRAGGIWNRNDNVLPEPVLSGKNLPYAFPSFVDAHSIDLRSGVSEVGVLEGAVRGLDLRREPERFESLLR